MHCYGVKYSQELRKPGIITARGTLVFNRITGFREQLSRKKFRRPFESAFLVKVELVNLKQDSFCRVARGGCNNFGVNSF